MVAVVTKKKRITIDKIIASAIRDANKRMSLLKKITTKKTITIPTVSKNKKQFIDEEEESEEEGEIKSEEEEGEIESEEEEVEIVSEFKFSGVDDGDASDEEEEGVGETWELRKIYTMMELNRSKHVMCENDDCDLVACSWWESNEYGKSVCLNCQAA